MTGWADQMIDGALREARDDVREYVTDSVGMADISAAEGDRLLAVIDGARDAAHDAARDAYMSAPDDGKAAYVAALDAAHRVFDPLLPDTEAKAEATAIAVETTPLPAWVTENR